MTPQERAAQLANEHEQTAKGWYDLALMPFTEKQGQLAKNTADDNALRAVALRAYAAIPEPDSASEAPTPAPSKGLTDTGTALPATSNAEHAGVSSPAEPDADPGARVPAQRVDVVWVCALQRRGPVRGVAHGV